MIITLLVILHVIVCLFLILVVLLQQGKSADWAGTFGGGSSQVAFGARAGATLLTKATAAAAIIFMVTSLALTILIGRTGSESVLPADATAPVTTPAPATTPAPETPAPAAPETPQQAPTTP
jgi:preprotein translocase subunit SecG